MSRTSTGTLARTAGGCGGRFQARLTTTAVRAAKTTASAAATSRERRLGAAHTAAEGSRLGVGRGNDTGPIVRRVEVPRRGRAPEAWTTPKDF